MATLFQIRRGSGSVSLVDGEIYLHKGYNSLQVSSGTTPITLAKINDINSGSLYLAGNITASNAYFSGDVAISGNLFLGNTSGDNISVPGVFTTNLVPGANGTLDLGTNGAKWRTLWANSVTASLSGSVNGIDVTDFSVSVDSRLDNLQDFTASVTGAVNKMAYFNTPNTITSYFNAYLNTQTFGLGTDATSSLFPERLMVDNSGENSFNIATFQTSQQDTYAQLNIKNFGSGSSASTDLILWNDVATESSSYFDVGINSSNYTADQVGYAGDGYVYSSNNDVYIGSIATGSSGHVHLFGGNNWKSSSITVYTDGTIGINTDKFDNDAETIPTPGYIMEISGNVVFNNNVDVIGNISSSTISGMGGVSQFVTSMQASTASLNIHSQSVNDRFNDLATISGSLILTASANTISITNINTETASLESRAISLATITGSLILTASANTIAVSNLNAETASLESRASALATISGSLILTASNHEQRISNIQSYTSSLRNAIEITGSSVTFFGDITVYGTQSIINSTNLAVADNLIYLNNESTVTDPDLGIVGNYNDGTYAHTGIFRDASDDGIWKVFKGLTIEPSGTIDTTHASFRYADFAANNISASSLNGIGNITAYSTSVDSRLVNLQSKSASVDNSVSLLGQYTQSQDTKNSTLQSYTSSVNSDLASIHQTTASLNGFSASVTSSLVSIYQTTASLNLFSASVTSSLVSIYQTTASLNVASSSLQSFSSSALLRLTSLETETGSLEGRASSLATITGSLITTASLNTIAITNLNLETASLESRATAIATITGSLISSASSFESRFATLETETASLESRATEIGIVTASLISSASSFESRFGTIGSVTASFEGRFTTLAQVTGSIHQFTSSLNSYTTSTEVRLDDLEYTASISVGAGLAAEFTKINQFTASANLRLDALETNTSSTDTRLDALEAYSASYAQYFIFDGNNYHIDFNV